MIENDFYTEENHGSFETFDLGDFNLTRGGTLPDCQLAYATFGELSPAKDNAILFPVMFSGTSGSLKHYVDKDLALDPEKYFIVIPNQLGGGISSSPHNTPAPHGMSHFPKLDIADDVIAQHTLLTQHFGINELQLVTGWSMGSQQTWEWAVRYPDMVRRAAPIAGTAKVTPHNALYVDVFSDALRSDPAWQNGEYTDAHGVETGLRRLARVFALMGVCPEFYRQEQWKRVGIDSVANFYAGFWEKWFLPMDANALLCMADKWKHGDVSAPYSGGLEEAMGRITAKVAVVAFKEDMFVPVNDCADDQKLVANSELHVVESLLGHFSMLGLFPEDFKQLNVILGDLLNS